MALCLSCHKEFEDGSATCPYCGANWADPLVGKWVAGKYEVIEKVGSGGMAVIYRARQHPIKRLVALKILNPSHGDYDSKLKRFLGEAERASRLTHPHAITIHDFGETENGLLYMAMEFIEGDTLGDVLARERVIPERVTLHIARQVAEVLREAHDKGIVHRDLKPGNIMIERQRGGMHIYATVLDFGISKLLGEGSRTTTDTGMLIGTPSYMSPEQCQGRGIDARSDIYSFGIILYEMLAGDVPFKTADRSLATVLAMHLKERPPPIRSVNPNVKVSDETEKLIMKMLAKDKSWRPQGMKDVLRAIDEIRRKGEPEGAAIARRNTDVLVLVKPVRAAEGGKPVVTKRIPSRTGRPAWVAPLVVCAIAVPALTFGLTAVRRYLSRTPRAEPPAATAESAADPARAERFLGVGMTLLGEGKFEKAESVLASALQSDPANAVIPYHLARARVGLGTLEEAIASYRLCLASVREDSDSTQLRQKALKEVERIEAAAKRLREGDRLRNENRHKEAIPAYQAALAEVPANLVARKGLAISHFEIGDKDRAKAEFHRVIKNAPDDAVARYYLGLLK